MEFGSTTDAAPILYAFNALPDLLDAAPTKKAPAKYLDARKVEVDVVPHGPGGWWAQVFPAGRPEATMDRNGYVFCVLDLFHKRLKHRDIFATASARWADPRAQLLTEAAWQSKREALLDELELPDDPDDLLDGCAAELDAKWRYMAERASAGDITVDAGGRVHAAALEAIPAPASMLALRDRCQDMMPPVDIRTTPPPTPTSSTGRPAHGSPESGAAAWSPRWMAPGSWSPCAATTPDATPSTSDVRKAPPSST